MLLGGSVFKAFRDTSGGYVLLYFVSFVLFETFILMNMFIAILCDNISDSSSLEELQQEDLEFVDFSYKRLLDIVYCCFPQSHQNHSSFVASTKKKLVPLSEKSHGTLYQSFDFTMAIERIMFRFEDIEEEQREIYTGKLRFIFKKMIKE